MLLLYALTMIEVRDCYTENAIIRLRSIHGWLWLRQLPGYTDAATALELLFSRVEISGQWLLDERMANAEA